MSLTKIGIFNPIIQANERLFRHVYIRSNIIGDYVNNIISVYTLQKTDKEKAFDLAEERLGHRVEIDTLYDETILEELKTTYEELLPAKELIEELGPGSLRKDEIRNEIKSLINFKTNQ